MKHISVLVLALALAAPAVALNAPSAPALLKRIAKEGGHKVLWDLWEREKEYTSMLEGIESADPLWLKVAAALKPFSDAGASLTLDYAVAFALPKAPSRVLPLIGHGFRIDDICTSPFLEPEAGEDEAYERKALAALAKLKGSTLEPLAAKCAAQIRLATGSH